MLIIHSTRFKARLVNREVKHFGMASNEVFWDNTREMELGRITCLDMYPSSSGQTFKWTIRNNKNHCRLHKISIIFSLDGRRSSQTFKKKIWKWSKIKPYLGSRNSRDIKILSAINNPLLDLLTIRTGRPLTEQAVIFVTLI